MAKKPTNRDRSHIFSDIRTRYHSLSAAQKRVADFILGNSREVLYLSISDLALKCEVSEPTILRFLKKIDYSSYQVFRVEIAQINAGTAQDFTVSKITPGDSTQEVIDKVIASTSTAVLDAQKIIAEKEIAASVRAILGAKRIYLFGAGSSAYIAGDLYHKLSRLGITALTETNEQMMAILSAQTDHEDVVILVSHSGESSSVLESAETAKKNGAFVCALTSYAHSSLATRADCTLLSSSSETEYRPDAMLSRIIQLVIVDIITISCVVQMGETAIDSIKSSQLAVARHKR